MDISTRYDRWLAIMAVLIGLYMVVQSVWAGSDPALLLPGLFGLYILHKLYKAGVAGWRRFADDLGGGMLTLLMLVLMVWGYFSIRS